jgi:hypothetical protein
MTSTGYGVPTARLKCFDLVKVNLLCPEGLYRMHHTLHSEEADRSNAPFFTNTYGLVFGHGSSTSDFIALDVANNSL